MPALKCPRCHRRAFVRRSRSFECGEQQHCECGADLLVTATDDYSDDSVVLAVAVNVCGRCERLILDPARIASVNRELRQVYMEDWFAATCRSCAGAEKAPSTPEAEAGTCGECEHATPVCVVRHGYVAPNTPACSDFRPRSPRQEGGK